MSASSSSPSAASASSVTTGVAIRRWILSMTSSSRSSDSHSSQRAAAGGGQPAQEGRVDRLVDAEGEDPGRAQPRRQVAQDLVLVADLAVGDQHQDAVAVVVAAGEQVGGAAERRGHLGAAAGLEPGEELDRAEAVAVGGRRQARGQAGRLVDDRVEGEDREPVLLAQGVDHAGDGAARAHHLPAAHRARAVDDEDDVARAGRAGGARRRQRSA